MEGELLDDIIPKGNLAAELNDDIFSELTELPQEQSCGSKIS